MALHRKNGWPEAYLPFRPMSPASRKIDFERLEAEFQSEINAREPSAPVTSPNIESPKVTFGLLK
jgi:hypothetical protein